VRRPAQRDDVVGSEVAVDHGARDRVVVDLRELCPEYSDRPSDDVAVTSSEVDRRPGDRLHRGVDRHARFALPVRLDGRDRVVQRRRESTELEHRRVRFPADDTAWYERQRLPDGAVDDRHAPAVEQRERSRDVDRRWGAELPQHPMDPSDVVTHGLHRRRVPHRVSAPEHDIGFVVRDSPHVAPTVEPFRSSDLEAEIREVRRQ
jgi:hypothetical protein